VTVALGDHDGRFAHFRSDSVAELADVDGHLVAQHGEHLDDAVAHGRDLAYGNHHAAGLCDLPIERITLESAHDWRVATEELTRKSLNPRYDNHTPGAPPIVEATATVLAPLVPIARAPALGVRMTVVVPLLVAPLGSPRIDLGF